jgi:hypothetical protein
MEFAIPGSLGRVALAEMGGFIGTGSGSAGDTSQRRVRFVGTPRAPLRM